jgi:Tfp pilus assembly protein PilN
LIQVNLLPGATRKAARKGGSRASFMPKFGNMPKLDRWVAAIAAAWVIGISLAAWMYFTTSSAKQELTLSLDQAVRDSAHYATVIQATERLRQRRDTIAQKLEIIQDIDSKRYIWPHIMDEVSRALPEYTWLTGLYQTKSDSLAPLIRIEGQTGTTFALTKFMTDLEASPFLSGVHLSSTEQVLEQGKAIYNFMLEARYEEPPPGVIQTVPLFKAED